jgi:hypothetical protein
VSTVDATFYALVEPDLINGRGEVVRAKVRRATVRPPAGGIPVGSVVVKLTLRVPQTVFAPLTPDVIDVPAELVAVVPEVEAP